ncbi:hypothetical protein A2774_03190 [Candidatus Roizmanbacteria bacterium RIFCSPHIGHO2_01_FULL_39_12c]|uniref:Uncharacterized protein n=1 Tax=Candidatus Roizmanbacteria bacterium RIFCSPHIGHO2_01_FULL_39_12c TaxID=1802031 RepID=A0A1F7GCK0_9BACT|nr:MAG: hypothetical protein A2774_03190 [Candidatus Roizmanbacteria bacterium RIFCSPHIGHO2_01_FULL_39_12c]
MEKAGNHVVECLGYESLCPVYVGEYRGVTHKISWDENAQAWQYTRKNSDGGEIIDYVSNQRVSEETNSQIEGKPNLRFPTESDFIKPQVPPAKTSV